MARDAPPRWSLVHARAIAAIVHVVFGGADAQKVTRKALRPEWRGPDGGDEDDAHRSSEAASHRWPGDARGGGVNNAERVAIADAILGVEASRLRLAYRALSRLRARGGEEEGDARCVAALAALVRDCGVDDDDDDARDPPDRAACASAAEAMLASYWAGADDDDDDADGVDARHRAATSTPTRRLSPGALDALLLAENNENDPVQVVAPPADPAANIAVEHSLPAWLARRFVSQHGVDGASALAASLRLRGPVIARANLARCASVSALAEKLREERVRTQRLATSDATSDTTSDGSLSLLRRLSRGAPDALALPDGRPKVGGIFGLRCYRDGAFEVQDAGSQCVAAAAAEAVLASAAAASASDAATSDRTVGHSLRTWRVLDACAGNGGKALAIASALSRGDAPGVRAFAIDCHDVDERRLRHLRAAAARAGFGEGEDGNSRTVSGEIRTVDSATLRAVARGELPAYDAVLVDAPCSSTGALRRFPSLRWTLDESKTSETETETESETETSSSRALLEYWNTPDAAYDADAVGVDGHAPVSDASWPALQRRVLARFAGCVAADGGALVYATCSLLDAENVGVSRWFERAKWTTGAGEGADASGEDVDFVTFEPDPFPRGWPGEEDADARATHEVALRPDAHGCDGFYIARWRRRRKVRFSLD